MSKIKDDPVILEQKSFEFAPDTQNPSPLPSGGRDPYPDAEYMSHNKDIRPGDKIVVDRELFWRLVWCFDDYEHFCAVRDEPMPRDVLSILNSMAWHRVSCPALDNVLRVDHTQ